MNKYRVEVQVVGKTWVVVEAESSEDAFSKVDNWGLKDLVIARNGDTGFDLDVFAVEVEDANTSDLPTPPPVPEEEDLGTSDGTLSLKLM